MSRRIFLTWSGVFLLGLIVAVTGQTSRPKKIRPPETVTRASWTPNLESSFGITQQQFGEMGLGVLSQSQVADLLLWVEAREQQAKASVPNESFTCGRTGESIRDAKPESYDQVRVYITASGDADEIISGVRERLRVMNGTEVVYNSEEADLVVSLVTVKTRAKGASYQTGTAISVLVAQPCLWKFGSYTNHYDTVQDQFVQVGSDNSTVVSSIVSSIDTDALENQRKLNAGLKKFLQGNKQNYR